MFSRRLKRPLTGDEQLEAEKLAHDVGYLPIALELAASRIARGVKWAALREAMEQEVARLGAGRSSPSL